MWRVGSNRLGRTLRLKVGWHGVGIHETAARAPSATC